MTHDGYLGRNKEINQQDLLKVRFHDSGSPMRRSICGTSNIFKDVQTQVLKKQLMKKYQKTDFTKVL